ncbi:Homoserine/homoserine lactone efflux protein [Roseobacter fucihabitans]|uniref:Homoserine/homoserine lactone efflux protein n=1 Tax=Roseobacter fucihabitans TaxID=1537242 RepID=A0ABZ2BVM9_9RHOB|nr:LysE family translocator [Roseobacter litoralis]MBC6967165.1 Homoserine/homoserine lactone efflux protein [Roseobacter litoralis]
MVDPLTLVAFIPAALALNLTPGADMMFCLGQGVRAGPRAAWLASAGIATGGMIHVLLAGAGLSALIASAPIAFDVIRWIGVTYLLWLAFCALRNRPRTDATLPAPRGRPFRQGLLVNLTNPKVILFVLAFMPQFIRPEAGPVLTQFAIFGAVIGLGGFAINGLVGVFASSLGQRLARGSQILDWITAGIFTALAGRLALLERS